MRTLSFFIDVHVSPDTLWRVLWGEETFGDWTSAFAPGSRIRAEWREGGRFEFTDSTGGVSYGTIRRLIPGEIVDFEHVGEIRDGTESPYADGPRREVYTLERRDEAVRLTLDQDVPEEFAQMFAEATPRAFARVKELSETSGKPA